MPSRNTARVAGIGTVAASLWSRVPYALITAVAAGSTLGYVVWGLPDYAAFWSMGTRMRLPDGTSFRVPLTRVLVDLTFVLMGVSFLLRRAPIRRNAHLPHVALAALGGCLPMLPYLFGAALNVVAPSLRPSWRAFFMEPSPAWWRTVGAVGCLILGNGLDAWAYLVMYRAFSVVPEARELVTRGPFRWLRHPVYTGQILAQGGVWLLLATAHGIWALFFGGMVALQLWRARAEERVLLAAFGDAYRDHAARTWWLQRPAPDQRPHHP